MTRREDPAILTGTAKYIHDIQIEGMRYAGFVRSTHAHASIVSIDTSRIDSSVVQVITHLPAFMPAPNPLLPIPADYEFPVLAKGEVHYVGQPIAVVIADTKTHLHQALEAVVVDYADAPSAFDPASPFTQVAYRQGEQLGERTTAASLQVQVQMDNPRLIAMSLEPRGLVAQWDVDAQQMTVWLGTQSPHRAQENFAAALAVDRQQVRVISEHVGGAFGAKATVTPEDIALVLSCKQLAERTNKTTALCWHASRSEEFLSGMHGRGGALQGTLEAAPDGALQSLNANLQFDLGAWIPFSGVASLKNAARILPGPYRVPHIDVQGVAYRSHKAPTNIYRGAGRPEAALLMETLMDKAARALRMDPLELRHRNLIPTSAMPYTTPTGEVIDSGDYAALLDACAQKFDYQNERALQAKRRAASAVVGLGIGLYIEPCGQGFESARVTLFADGSAEVASGSPAQGQGHATTFTQIAARELAIDAAKVRVVFGDTQTAPEGIGTLASRSIAIGGSAIAQACREVLAKRDVGEVYPITVQTKFTSKETWSSGCVMVRLIVNKDTGKPSIEKLVWVDDAGVIVSPTLAHGQLVGGAAQGIGQALFEALHHDQAGQLITGSLMDYAVPRANDMPEIDIQSLCTPATTNLLGAKGVGEAGTIGIPAAILNAAMDALSPRYSDNDLTLNFPLTPEKLWRAIAPKFCTT